MTTPALSMDSAFGRLYAAPGVDVEVGTPHEMWALIESGVLHPSVTNVLGVGDKPFLKSWAARLAAQTAVDMARRYPQDLADRPDAAAKWAAATHERTLHDAAALGDAVHNACERLALGLPVGPIGDQVTPYLQSWEKFVADFSPTFVRVESTVFGTTDGGGYAGTADFIAEIGGMNFSGDYKSGRNVYDSAGQQLAALSNAARIVSEDGVALEPNLPTVGGLVVHLTPKGYKVCPVDTGKNSEAWRSFAAYRQAWKFHARSLAASQPVLLQQPVSNADALLEVAVQNFAGATI